MFILFLALKQSQVLLEAAIVKLMTITGAPLLGSTVGIGNDKLLSLFTIDSS